MGFPEDSLSAYSSAQPPRHGCSWNARSRCSTIRCPDHYLRLITKYKSVVIIFSSVIVISNNTN